MTTVSNTRTHRGTVAKDIVHRFYPEGASRPEGLLTAIFIALGEAEQRGFADCIAIFEPRDGANDNRERYPPNSVPPNPK